MSEEKVDLKELVAKRKEFERLITAKAMEDEAYRKALLENPRGVIEKELGQKLPDELKVQVVEESANSIFLALPPKPTPGGELSGEALEKAAGGIISSSIGLVSSYSIGSFSRILLTSSTLIR
jgi:hypothetical protein